MQNAERTLLFNQEEQRKKLRDFPELCRPQEHAFAAKTIPVHRKKNGILSLKSKQIYQSSIS